MDEKIEFYDLQSKNEKMENNSIIKTKLQFIPGAILFIFGVFLVVAKLFNIYTVFWMIRPLCIYLMVLFAVLAVAFIAVSLFLCVFKIIKKNNDWTLLLKKTSLISLEFVILSPLFFYVAGCDFIESYSDLSKAQIKEYIQKLNELKVGEEVSQPEINAIKLLFKSGTPSEFNADMQREKRFYSPQGSPSAYQKSLLKIEKLNKECYYVDEKYPPLFKNCANGDLYVRYGWDRCIPHYSMDCLGENYYENYLIRNEEGKYKIIETY